MSKENIDLYVQDCIKRIKARQLPPHHTANLHVISYLKESQQYDTAVEFWNWVVNQDDSYVDLKTYGAAIELLAACGRGLESCEEVYAHGLKRFPGNFNKYHMSHGALLQNRDKLTILPRTSMTLMQGIVAARLTYGDWRNAYLGLDTALRLHPTQLPPYMLQAFVRERPIQEAYQVFCLLCQGGNPVRPETVTAMLSNLVDGQGESTGEEYDLDIAMAVLNAIRLYAGSGQNIKSFHLNLLLQSSLCLPSINQALQAEANESGDDSAIQLINRVLPLFASLGVEPEPSTYSIIISAAIRLRHKVLLNSAFGTLSASISAPGRGRDTNATLSILLKTTAKIGDPTRVEQIWNSRNQALTSENWIALVQATIFTDNNAFLEKQLEIHGLSNDQSVRREIKRWTYKWKAHKEATKEESKEEPVANEHTRAKCIAVVSRFSAALDGFRNLVETSDYQNLKKYPPNSLSICSAAESANETWQKELYNEMTLDSTTTCWEHTKREPLALPVLETQNARDMGPIESSTGIPLDELRYRNWKKINELMQHAELFEARIEKSVAKAIAEGKPARQVRSANGIELKRLRQYVVRGHLMDHFHDMKKRNVDVMTELEWKEKILQLRRGSNSQVTEN